MCCAALYCAALPCAVLCCAVPCCATLCRAALPSHAMPCPALPLLSCHVPCLTLLCSLSHTHWLRLSQIGQEYQVGSYLVKPFKTYHTVPSQASQVTYVTLDFDRSGLVDFPRRSHAELSRHEISLQHCVILMHCNI